QRAAHPAILRIQLPNTRATGALAVHMRLLKAPNRRTAATARPRNQRSVSAAESTARYATRTNAVAGPLRVRAACHSAAPRRRATSRTTRAFDRRSAAELCANARTATPARRATRRSARAVVRIGIDITCAEERNATQTRRQSARVAVAKDLVNVAAVFANA